MFIYDWNLIPKVSNYLRAWRFFINELKSLKNDDVNKIIERWDIKEVNIDKFPRIGIEFPEDLKNNIE